MHSWLKLYKYWCVWPEGLRMQHDSSKHALLKGSHVIFNLPPPPHPPNPWKAYFAWHKQQSGRQQVNLEMKTWNGGDLHDKTWKRNIYLLGKFLNDVLTNFTLMWSPVWMCQYPDELRSLCRLEDQHKPPPQLHLYIRITTLISSDY